MVHVPPVATEVPQLLFSEKLAGFEPANPMLKMLNAALPLLVNVTVCPALVVPRFWLKVRFEALRLTEGPLPVPVRLTAWGLPTASSAIVRVAARLPVAPGVNVTLMVQLPPAASEPPQLFDAAKSPGLVPDTAMLEKFKAALPLFVRVTDWAGVVVPCNWLPNASVVEERPTVAEVPVPVMPRVWGLPAALSVKTREAVRGPEALGTNVSVAVHCAEGASEGTQLSFSVKSPLLGPVI